MSPEQLRAECARSVAAARDEDRRGRVILQLAGKRGDTEYVRLAGRSGPRGRVVGSHENGTLIVDFYADDILRWLDKVAPDCAAGTERGPLSDE